MNSNEAYTLCDAHNNTEKEAIYRFRFEIFGREMGLLGPLEQWESPSFYDDLDKQSHHIFADRNGEVVGAIRITSGKACATAEEFLETYELEPFLKILSADKIAVITRLMVHADFRGSQLSLRLIKKTTEYCLKQGIECFFLDCQPHLVPLYQRLGCRPYRSVFNDKFVGIMIPLVFILFDIEHLTKIRSPLKKMIQQKSPQPEVKPELRKLVQSAPAIISEEIQGDEFFSGVINEHLQTSSKLSEDWGVLEGFSQNDIDTLSKGSYIIRCNQGDTIIHKNHATRTMFLVIDGVLEVQKAGRTAGFVCKGDVTGEYSYLVNTPRSANVIVVSEKASLLAFEIKHMNHLINNHPALAARCLLNLSRSLCVKIISKETSIEPE